MADFSTWYHGTLRANVPSIKQRGLTVRWYGLDPHGVGSPYHVLLRRRELEPWGHPGTGTGALVTVHVPDNERAEYLTCPDGPCQCGGVYSGLFKPLPVRMVWSVEDT